MLQSRIIPAGERIVEPMIGLALYWLVDFLGDTAVLVVWTDPQELAGNQTLLSVLERVGLVVEAGSIHKHGCAVSARRAEITPNRKVA